MTVIKIDSEIGYWGISSRDIKYQLENASGDIKVEINSPGGSVIEGIAIFNALKDYDKGNIEVVIVGLAASMASYIALAGDTIKAYDNAIYMIHNASGVTWGDYREFEKYSKYLFSMSAILKRAYISRTGKDEKEIQSLMDDETYYFGNEILEAGFIDEIIKTENEIQQDEGIALAKETFKACMHNVQKNSKDDEVEQIAAIVKDIDKTLRVNSASAQIEKNSKKGDNSMEYTKESFEALENAHAEALKTKENDVLSSERQRVSDIMALSGDLKTKEKAIKDGLTVGECAIELNKAYSEQASKEKTDFEQASSEVANIQTESDNGENLTAEELAIKEDDEAYYKARKGER